EREWKHRRAEPLHGPEEDQDPDVPGRRRSDTPEEEERERDDEQPLFPVLVAELAEDRSRHRGDEQEDREHPGHPGRRRVQFALEGGQGRDDHGLLQGVGRAGDRQDRERDVVVLALLRHYPEASAAAKRRSPQDGLRLRGTAPEAASSSPRTSRSRPPRASS